MKRSALLILFVTIFIDLLGFGLILPLLPVYIQHYNGKPWVGGALLSSYSAMQFLFAPIWGRVSDRHGRRPMILMSLLGSATSFYFFGAAKSLLVLFTARVSAGILTAASLPTAQAYIADVTTAEKRASGMVVIGAAFGLGFAIGPVLSGILSQHPILGISSLAMPAYFAAILALCNFVWAFFMLPETHVDRAQSVEMERASEVLAALTRSLRNPAIRRQLLVFAFSTFAFVAVESSFSWLVILRFKPQIHAMTAHNMAHISALSMEMQKKLFEKAETKVTSNIFMIIGLVSIFTYGAVGGGMARRIGENRMVMFGTLLLTVTLVGIAFAHQLWMIQVLSALIAVGSGVISPSINALITESAGPQERGTVSGAQQSLGSFSRMLAPTVNNYLVGINTAIPFIGSAFIMAVAFTLSLRLRPMQRPPEATVPQSDGGGIAASMHVEPPTEASAHGAD